MLRHQDIWRGIDRLAAAQGLSVSALARQAGLDPTTFNKSKRTAGGGRARWPSTESIAKLLEATDTPIGEFAAMMQGEPGMPFGLRIPVIGHAQAGRSGFFDDAGFPVGEGWDELDFPNLGDPNAYALEISGDSMEPVYRDGDIIVVSPSANVRRGDRVVARTRDGEVMVRRLARKTAKKVELQSLPPAGPDRTLEIEEVDWLARIVWTSQ